MEITLENVEDFLDTPLSGNQSTQVQAWLGAISSQLNVTFGYGGKALGATVAPAVYSTVADAITRRLSRKNFDPRLRGQSVGPSAVTYNVTVSQLQGWFYPDEALSLQAWLGGGNGGSLSSVRMPAPDAVRFGNLAPRFVSPEFFGLDFEGEEFIPDEIHWDNS